MRKLKILLVAVSIVFTLVNVGLLLTSDPYSKARISLLSFSKGDRYLARLSLWQLLIDNQQWELADTQEKYLRASDITVYKSKHHPDEIKKQLNNLIIKPGKITEDYLEIAKLQAKLGKYSEAQNSLLIAKNLDPVRDDINSLFFDSQTK